jgi:hypothetical protein
MLLERLSNYHFIDFLIIALATYRISVMLTHEWEVGPRRILAKLRSWAGWIEPAHGEAYAEEGSLASGMMCYFCNSIWVGVAFTLVYAGLLAAGLPAWLLFTPLAASGASVLLAEVTEGRDS